jgi:hypothetical protein
LGGPRDGARISSIFEDRKGRLCVLTGWDGGSLRVFTNNAFKLVAIPYPKDFAAYGWGSRQFGFQAHDGEWWLPSGGGLLRFTAGDIDDLPRAKLKALYDDRSGLHVSTWRARLKIPRAMSGLRACIRQSRSCAGRANRTNFIPLARPRIGTPVE